MKTGIELIAEERREQIKKHGRSLDHDMASNRAGELITTARALLIEDNEDEDPEDTIKERTWSMPSDWDETICKKMSSKPRRERLITAGALIAAELDLLNASKE